MKSTNLVKSLVLTAALFFGGIMSAQAALIKGQLNLGLISDITFADSNDYTTASNIELLFAVFAVGDGDFAGITTGDVTVPTGGSSVNIDPTGSGLPQIVWTAGDFTFTLESLSDQSTVDFLNITGKGTISHTGALEDTDGTFRLTYTGGVLASTFTAAVVEPSTIALMGLGLVGLGAIRRRRV